MRIVLPSFVAMVVAGILAFAFPISAQTSCLAYPSNSTPPNGYGASWDVFDSTKALMVKVNCPTSGNALTMTIGKGDANQYIWNEAYTYEGGWVKRILSGTQSNGWIAGSGTASITAPSNASVSAPLYFVGYACTNRGSAGWKCGCSNSSCTTGMWQIQGYTGVSQGGTTGGGTTGGGTGVGAWRIYDNISFSNEPSLNNCGMDKTLKIINPSALGSNSSTDFVQSDIDDMAASLAGGNTTLVVLDYENWRSGPDRSLSQTDADRYEHVINALRSAVRARGNTRIKFGFYGAPFMTRAMMARSAAARTLVDSQDFLTPSLYSSNPDEETNHSLFTSKANSYINAYKAMANGRPILAYIWPQFYGGDLHFLAGSFWTHQLTTLYTISDSVIVWGTLTTVDDHTRRPWDKTREWWIAQKNFISSKGVNVSACDD